MRLVKGMLVSNQAANRINQLEVRMASSTTIGLLLNDDIVDMATKHFANLGDFCLCLSLSLRANIVLTKPRLGL